MAVSKMRDVVVERFPEDGHALDLLGGLENDFLLSVMNASQDCIKILEHDGSLSFMNANGMCAMEIEDFNIVAQTPWPDLWPEYTRRTLLDAMAKARQGERSNFEAECPTLKGSQRWWNVTVLPLRNAAGDVDRILASSRDVTERVLREKEQKAYTAALETQLAEKTALLDQRQFLLREIDHRVKNSLAQVAAVLRIQGRRSSPEVQKALVAAAQRVGAIARVHEQLQTSDDFKIIPIVPLLDRMCKEFSDIFDGQIEVTSELAADYALPSEKASAICFVVSELVANAVRHGTKDGAITVQSHQNSKSTIVSVANAASGPRPLKDEISGGLGTQICETYAKMLGGRIDWTFADNRITATLEFPIIT
jgi:two-component system, sensor histidine kinase PdtaS